VSFQLALLLLHRPRKKGNFKLFVYTNNLKAHPIMKELNVKQDEKGQDYYPYNNDCIFVRPG
jgi:hypothetical protein